MCCGDAKADMSAPFEVDNPIAVQQPDGKYHFTADVYNAEVGYDTFGFKFDVVWADGSTDSFSSAMWLPNGWMTPKYTYHGATVGKFTSADMKPLALQTVTVRPDYAMSKDGKTWGNLEGLQAHLLQKEIFLRQGGGR